MKLLTAVTCIIFLLTFCACSAERRPATASISGGEGGERQEELAGYANQSKKEGTGASAQRPESNETTEASSITLTSMLAPGGSQAAQQPTVERKIIRDAEINIEVDSPTEGQRKLAAIAEAHGGFVVTSESRLQGGGASSAHPSEIVSVQMRVPATRFDAAIAEMRAIGKRVTAEKITGKDVTEEFIDLDARLRAQRALEAQFLEIMKRAGKVSDALEVHSQLAGVRTEIEQIEGRRRFLENQAALSTIKATLQPPAPLVSANTSGFLHGIREAFGDGVDIAAEIILGIIRFGIALLPVLLLIILPLALIWHFLLRPRFRRRRPKPGAAAPPVANAAP
jgi:hypothetical protein